MLASLAACPCIALLASFEHVNTPLLWDAQRVAAFHWLYFDTTTFEAYTPAETAGLPSLLSTARRALHLAAMMPVPAEASCLTSRARLSPGWRCALTPTVLAHTQAGRRQQERCCRAQDPGAGCRQDLQDPG